MTTEEFDFTEWLGGVEIPAEGVTVYQKPGLIGQLKKAQEVVAALGEAHFSERAIGDYDPRQEVERLKLEIARSKTVWYLAPLDRDVERKIAEAYPEPEPPLRFTEEPPRLADRATVEQSQAFMEAWAAYQAHRQLWEEENQAVLNEWREKVAEVAIMRGAERLAKSVAYIDSYDEEGRVTRKVVHLTADNILEAERRLGVPQMTVLSEALGRVSRQVIEPDPFESPTS